MGTTTDVDDGSDRGSYVAYNDGDMPAAAGREPEEDDEPKAGWWDMSWLLLSDVVGSSVLSFSGVTASVGWVISIFSMILFCYLAYYSAVLMSKARTMMEQLTGHSPGSMGEAARLLMGEKASKVTFFLVYGAFAFLGNASYLLVMGESLYDVFDYLGKDLCKMSASFYACLLVLPAAVSIRRLRNVSTVCFCNLFLILAVLFVCLITIAKDGRADNVTTDAVNPHITLLSYSQAMANTLYAYAGHWMYFEIMSEMAEPRDFPKVFYINAPLQLGMYMTVAVVGYYFLGSEGKHYLIDNLDQGSTTRFVVQSMLFVHISIAYLIKSVALTRFMVEHIQPAALDNPDTMSRILFAMCATSLLGAGWVVANAMPVFYDLVGLIGALLCGPISFVFPITYFILSSMREQEELQDNKQESKLMVSMPAEVPQGPPSLSSVLRHVESYVPRPTAIFMATLIMFIAMIMVTGSISSIKDINKKVQDGEASVFTC